MSPTHRWHVFLHPFESGLVMWFVLIKNMWQNWSCVSSWALRSFLASTSTLLECHTPCKRAGLPVSEPHIREWRLPSNSQHQLSNVCEAILDLPVLLTLQLTATWGMSSELKEWNQQRNCMGKLQNHEKPWIIVLSHSVLEMLVMKQMIADTSPKMYSLHKSESTLVKMQVRSCHSSAQITLALFHLTESKRVFFLPISCHSPPCSCVTSLEHVRHASSSASLPSLSPSLGTQLSARLIPSPPLYLYSPSLTTLYKAADTSSQPSFLSSLINFSPKPSPSADILYILWYLPDFPYQQRKAGWGHGFTFAVSLSPPSKNFLA